MAEGCTSKSDPNGATSSLKNSIGVGDPNIVKTGTVTV
jgi:hypothetical protein